MGSIGEQQPKMANKYTVRQATTKKDLDAIMDVVWAANYTPYEPFVQLFFPVLGYLPSDREAAIAESKERFWNNHNADPASNWYYVQEIETGKVVACAQWENYTQNPFPDGPPKLRAPWWPEGDHRDFCELILNQVYAPHATYMACPHLALNWMAVHPSHRRQGLGNLLMEEGTRLADSLDVECWMEASSMGKPLYEKHGFETVLKIAFNTEKHNTSDVWRKCEHEITPDPVFGMRRPKGRISK